MAILSMLLVVFVMAGLAALAAHVCGTEARRYENRERVEDDDDDE